MHHGKVYAPLASFGHHWISGRERLIVILGFISTLVLAGALPAVVGGAATHDTERPNSSGGVGNISTASRSSASPLKAICDKTLYPASCFSSLYPAVGLSSSQPLDSVKYFRLAVQVAINELPRTVQHLRDLGLRGHVESISAMGTCAELLELAIDRLNDVKAAARGDLDSQETIEDLKTWLSAVIAYKDTCMDAFEDASATFMADLGNSMQNTTEFTSNSLAILTHITNSVGSVKMPRRLLEKSDAADGLPRWLSSKDRMLLRSQELRMSANVVVAQDGSGKYRTIKAALDAVPEKSKKRFVIYVKKGVYKENVKVEKNKWNVMIIGDGKDATVVSASRSVVDGTNTFNTATFSVLGKGFVARHMGFRNTAGPAKHQAVALMSDSDQSVFYRCRFDAYQDTLYTFSARQFYRECDVYGTVDFIFGNAAVVFQSCNIFPRVPMKGQWNTITAQGKSDPNMQGGIVFHECSIRPSGDLSSVKVYLGRPWKAYSTVVFMKSKLPGVINPAGWAAWSGRKTAPSTVFFAEYQNSGPGASTRNRVKWKGVRASLTQQQAGGFTVGSFLGGKTWIPATGVPFTPGL